MKTTIEVSDALLDDAKREAARRGVTLRALFEEALRAVLVNANAKKATFKLRDASVRGRGLSPEFADRSWEDIRAAIYRGRGS